MKTAEAYLERTVGLIVIHCSALRCNVSSRPAMPENSLHGSGNRREGCHFYIRRNGEICQRLPVSCPGSHTAGFNLHSIGICYEGGRDDNGTPADTRTVWQKRSLNDLICALRTSFPAAAVTGHDRLTADLQLNCPGFDAEGEYGKENRKEG